MRKVYGFLLAVAFLFLCLEVGVKAVTYYDAKNVGGDTVLAAYATNEAKYWTASVRVAGAGVGINVEAWIKTNEKICARCKRVMTDASPLEDGGAGKMSSVEAWGKSASYEVSVSNP